MTIDDLVARLRDWLNGDGLPPFRRVDIGCVVEPKYLVDRSDLRYLLGQVEVERAARVKAEERAEFAEHQMGLEISKREAVEAHLAEAEKVIDLIDGLAVMEINPSNYDHDDVCELSRNAAQAACAAHDYLEGIRALAKEGK